MSTAATPTTTIPTSCQPLDCHGVPGRPDGPNAWLRSQATAWILQCKVVEKRHFALHPWVVCFHDRDRKWWRKLCTTIETVKDEVSTLFLRLHATECRFTVAAIATVDDAAEAATTAFADFWSRRAREIRQERRDCHKREDHTRLRRLVFGSSERRPPLREVERAHLEADYLSVVESLVRSIRDALASWPCDCAKRTLRRRETHQRHWRHTKQCSTSTRLGKSLNRLQDHFATARGELARVDSLAVPA